MDTGSVNSVPSSVSGSSARSTPVPSHYKPLTQSASILALTKSPDDEIKRKGLDELVHILRRLETENRNLVFEHGNIMKDVNKKMQILLLEVRGLKDINQSLQDDNQELRDLCCFLDDDRQRGRKLAREWQRFGRYTASVMRSEVSAYQEKLKELEDKQQELISDNVDLKELCLYLDQERMRAGQTRDEGDGSSSSTVAGNEEAVLVDRDGIDLLPLDQLHGNHNSGSTEYVRHLEDKVKQLEAEKKNISQQLERSPDTGLPSPPSDTGDPSVAGTRRLGPDGNPHQDAASKSPNPGKPEAVVHAMKVLEVHENLERPITSVGEDNLDDKEKAIVREMCNVVWRKLGNVSSEGDSEHSTPHPVYENIAPSRSHSSPPDPSTRPPGPDRPPDRLPPPNASHPQEPPGIGIEPMPVYTAHPVQPMPQAQLQRSDPSLHTAAGSSHSQYSRSDVRQSGPPPQYTSAPGHRQAPPTSQPQRPLGGQVDRFPGDIASQSQPPPPPPNPHYNSQAPKYGYVRTTRSTPVTPTPQQRSHSPVMSASGRSGPVLLQQDRSASPRGGHRPNPQDRSASPRGPHRPNTQRSQSPGPQQRSQQYPRTDSQSSVHLYQNHHPAVSSGPGKGDNSYENIPHSYYYVTSSKGPGNSSEGPQAPRGPGYDHAGPQSHAGPRMSYSEPSHPTNRTAGNQSRAHNQQQPPPPPPSHSSSSQAQQQQYASHPYYQNIQYRNQNPQGKPSVRDRDPSPQGPPRTPQAPPYRPPQPPGSQYSQQYPPPTRTVSTSSSVGPPPQGQSGSYRGQQIGYTEYSDTEGQGYHGRRDNRGRQDGNQYYH